MKRNHLMAAIALLALTAGCNSSLQGSFTEEEKTVIASEAPQGRTDYDGKIMRIWKITDREDSLLLRKTAADVSEIMAGSEEFGRLCGRMLITVKDSLDEGVGIAAPQVGISRKLIAVQRFDKEGEPFEFYLNPEILEAGDSLQYGIEGCLSVPEIWGNVGRAERIKVRYRTPGYKDTVETVNGFTAVIFQHEIDHINGILFTDRMEGLPVDVD